MSCETPSSSECSIGSVEIDDFKCEVCLGKGHGNHFGVNACRACAAFFRRMILGTGHRQKCRLRKDCKPRDGRWFCKKCRLEKCYDLGMTPDNIQHDRDAHQSSQLFLENVRKRKLQVSTLPTTVEKTLGVPHSILYFKSEKLPKEMWTFIDLSPLVDRTEKILRTEPVFASKTFHMTTIEKLTYGLKEVRKNQQKYLPPIKCFGKEETCFLWENQLINAANWIMYFDEFRELPFEQKFAMIKCMWHLWGRLERLAMTAEMRVNGYCGKRQFVVSHDALVDYDNISCDLAWSSRFSKEELQCFLDVPSYYGEPLVDSFVSLNPTDTELVFLLCNLCLRLTGKKLGGEIEENTQKLQDVLADSLHKYYKDMEMPRYAHRLTKLLSIKNRGMNPSTSTSGPSTPDVPGKCQICFQRAHGKHFGVDSCRACAAFFRRVFVTHKQHFKCREGHKKCTPDIYGRWNCKRCRTDRCFALGMKPDNFSNQATKRSMSIEIAPSLPKQTSYVDLSPVFESLQKMLSDRSQKCGTGANPLQKLAYGLKEVRKQQIRDEIPLMKCIGFNESLTFWKSEVERACTWLSYFDEFQNMNVEDKLIITKCMWFIFTRLERSAMTAELRRAKKCGDSEFAFTTYSLINTETLKWDFEWLSHFPSDQMRNFLGTTPMILCEPLTKCMMEVQPTDEELCYILCDLCFYFLGSKLGGEMLEKLERYQKILSDNLHQYYLGKNKTSRYSHRLSQILKISQQYKEIMVEKRKIRILGEVFGAFRANWSHTDLFCYESFTIE